MHIIIHLILCVLLYPIIIIAAQKHTTLFQDIRAQNKEAVKKRLINGENCSIRNRLDNNALHSAIDEEDEEMIRVLTTIPYSSQLPSLYKEYKEKLPDINGKNSNGETPLCYALKRKNNNIVSLLITQNANIHIEDNKGFTPLHCAAAYDNNIGMNILQQHGALLEKRTHNGNTIAHIAAEKGNINALMYCIGYNALFLLDRNNNNETPLISAAKNGHTNLVQLLLYEVDFINEDIDMAIQLSHQNNHHETAEFLKQKNNERLRECQEINNMYTTIRNLIDENNRLLFTINKEYSHSIYTSEQLKYYSKEQLYKMYKPQRDDIKNNYLNIQKKELLFKNNSLSLY